MLRKGIVDEIKVQVNNMHAVAKCNEGKRIACPMYTLETYLKGGVVSAPIKRRFLKSIDKFNGFIQYQAKIFIIK